MDRIPKFRRKPKNPTIETAVERSSTDTIDSTASTELQAQSAAAQQRQKHQAQKQPNQQPQQFVIHHEPQIPQQSHTKQLHIVPPPKQPPHKHSRRAAFRNLRLRASAKRGRDSPPSELPSSPPPAIVSQDGVKSRPATADGEAIRNRNSSSISQRTGLLIPSFLALSTQEIDFRFQELTWSERDRVLEGSRNDAVEENRWGTFRQVDVEERGQMDRYMNIKPWNHNRVKLRVPDNELNYVNASAIALTSPSEPSQPPLRYIAMQGPTEPSFDYVWRMVAEQMASPAVIVQLTCMSEGGILKCHQYFPDNEEHSTWTLNESNAWGDGWQAQLTYDSYEVLSENAIEKRKLLLHVQGEEKPRVVWHLLYRKWPDFGVPELEDLDGFFELMKQSRKLSAPENARIIHCSAGVGRTGTFIALEHLIRELDSGALENYDGTGEGPDLVMETVDQLREQRVGMVQGRAQYQFIYQVMRKLWQDKYGIDEEGEPVAKRLEVVGDPFLDAGPGPDAGEVGVAR